MVLYMQKGLAGSARRKHGWRQNFRELLYICFFPLNFQGEGRAEYVPVHLFLGKVMSMILEEQQ